MAEYSTKQARKDAARRTRFRRKLLLDWQSVRQTIDDEHVQAVRKIPQDTWDLAKAADEEAEEEAESLGEALDWRSLMQADTFTNVQRLVHLAARYDSVDIERIRVQILDARRKAYNDELEIQAARVGCPGQQGRLGNSSVLSALNDLAVRDAASIANTYNYFLALEIIRSREVNVRANRFYYSYRLRIWNPTYWDTKDQQITTVNDTSARAMAQQDFYQFNGKLGTARLQPLTAVCPICKGWIARGVVSLNVALNNPPPYHIGCYHLWDIRPSKVKKEDCPLLWMGE